jgi:hypothetical protein
MDETERQHAALTWLNLHWQGSKACPICGNTSWSVGNVVELREFSDGALVVLRSGWG